MSQANRTLCSYRWRGSSPISGCKIRPTKPIVPRRPTHYYHGR